ncbi:MAG: RNA methyltransferase [Gammaproteobacteria bacterium AqS3]|nr:RNA methyltransferase [Gammaproteobacteria bacterium AqS3]
MPPVLDQIRIVLVHTTHPGNIGAAARAMVNMGLGRLVLVAPKRFPDPEAGHRAKGGLSVLENARVVDTLDEAIADCTLVVGTSARTRKVDWPCLDARDSAVEMITAAAAGRTPAAVLFGREDRGLLNSELQRCHWQLNIPSNEDYSSLNLAMAVQLVAYEILCSARAQQGEMAEDTREWPSSAELEYMHEHLRQVLLDVEFYDPDNPGLVPVRVRKLFTQLSPDAHELGMLRGFLSAIQNALAGRSKRRGRSGESP